MATFRDIKRQARLTLHTRMGEPVLYVTDAGTPAEVKTSVIARLHLNFDQIGDLLRGGFAEREELSPTVVLLGSYGQPTRGAIIVTKDMGAWRIELVKPPNDITISVEVVKLTDKQVGDLDWDSGLQYMGLGDPTPITPVGPPELPLPKFKWEEDEW